MVLTLFPSLRILEATFKHLVEGLLDEIDKIILFKPDIFLAVLIKCRGNGNFKRTAIIYSDDKKHQYNGSE